jgi:hypothetical protein
VSKHRSHAKLLEDEAEARAGKNGERRARLPYGEWFSGGGLRHPAFLSPGAQVRSAGESSSRLELGRVEGKGRRRRFAEVRGSPSHLLSITALPREARVFFFGGAGRDRASCTLRAVVPRRRRWAGPGAQAALPSGYPASALQDFKVFQDCHLLSLLTIKSLL